MFPSYYIPPANCPRCIVEFNLVMPCMYVYSRQAFHPQLVNTLIQYHAYCCLEHGSFELPVGMFPLLAPPVIYPSPIIPGTQQSALSDSPVRPTATAASFSQASAPISIPIPTASPLDSEDDDKDEDEDDLAPQAALRHLLKLPTPGAIPPHSAPPIILLQAVRKHARRRVAAHHMFLPIPRTAEERCADMKEKLMYKLNRRKPHFNSCDVDTIVLPKTITFLPHTNSNFLEYKLMGNCQQPGCGTPNPRKRKLMLYLVPFKGVHHRKFFCGGCWQQAKHQHQLGLQQQGKALQCCLWCGDDKQLLPEPPGNQRSLWLPAGNAVCVACKTSHEESKQFFLCNPRRTNIIHI